MVKLHFRPQYLREKKTTIRRFINAGAILSSENKAKPGCVGRHKVSGVLLVSAIEWGDYALIKGLIEAGANIDALGSSDSIYWDCWCVTPLTAAIRKNDLNLVNYLIRAGAAINNPPGCMGMTALSAAVRNRDLKLVDYLIQLGANPYDARALGEATNDFRLLQVLLTALHNYDEQSDSNDLGRDALRRAIYKQDQIMIKAILNSPLRDIKSTTSLSNALHDAIAFDSSPNLGIIRLFLSSGADPNIVRDLISPLHVAINTANLQKVQLLLEAGAQADRNLKCAMNLSPMQLAVLCGKQDIVQELLNYESDPNAVSQTSGYGTPIQLAVDNQEVEVTRILLQYKGNPNTVFGHAEHTPLQVASRDGSKEIVGLLLEHGADVNSPPAKLYGATALQFAAIKGYLGIAHLLLEYSADVNAPPAAFDERQH